MTARTLPVEEWPKLHGTDLGLALTHAIDPARVKVVVVEDGGEIVGCWGAFAVIHAEGVWIAPAHRTRGSVARRLWAGMRRVVREWGASQVITGADRPEIASLIERHGGSIVPFATYVLPLE